MPKKDSAPVPIAVDFEGKLYEGEYTISTKGHTITVNPTSFEAEEKREQVDVKRPQELIEGRAKMLLLDIVAEFLK